MTIEAQLSALEPYTLAIVAKEFCPQLSQGRGGNLVRDHRDRAQLKSLIHGGSRLEQGSRDTENIGVRKRRM